MNLSLKSLLLSPAKAGNYSSKAKQAGNPDGKLLIQFLAAPAYPGQGQQLLVRQCQLICASHSAAGADKEGRLGICPQAPAGSSASLRRGNKEP
jgi:hypothetical protein